MRSASGPVAWLVLPALLLGALLVHLLLGGVFGFSEIWSALLQGPKGDSPAQTVLWQLRLPRACAAALVGANLACAGAVFQSLFRNPLADPYIVGVSSGAAVGGAIATLIGITGVYGSLGGFGLAFLTALLGLGIVVSIGRGRGTIALSSLLMAGVAVGSFLWALVTCVLVWAGQDSGKVLFWLLGSFVGMDWNRVMVLCVIGVIGIGLLSLNSRALTVFSVGEESAARLGVETEKLKWSALLIGSALAAASVSAVGIIGFVGLFVPHIARRLFGNDFRQLLPACVFLGAAGVVLSDTLAQRLIPGQEINVGVITALIGAPFLMVLLRRRV